MKKSYLALLAVMMFTCSLIAPVHAEGMPEMDPAQAEMMAKMQERMAPNAAHEVMKPLEGEWTYTMKFWMQPGAEAEETTGTTSQKMIYGGRFLEQKVSGSWMGQPFEGTGLLGYDNVKEEYTSLWYDNMMTGIMTTTGSYDEATQTFQLSGENSCPMTGETHKSSRVEYEIVDENSNIYRAYMTTESGEEHQGMEILYTRVS